MHPLEPAVRALAATGLARSPGAAFEYSNLNYTTLGLVVEMAAGEPFDDYLKRHIFEPLDMHRTYTAIEDAQRGGLASGYRPCTRAGAAITARWCSPRPGSTR